MYTFVKNKKNKIVSKTIKKIRKEYTHCYYYYIQ